MVERQLFIPRLSEIREQVITDGMIDYIVENTRFLMLRINKRRDGSFQLTSTMTAGTFSNCFLYYHS